jgi:hypothetical protein
MEVFKRVIRVLMLSNQHFDTSNRWAGIIFKYLKPKGQTISYSSD